MARPTILLNRQTIAEHIQIASVIAAIERAMADFERGNDYLPPKAIYELPVPAAFAACIAGYTKAAHLMSMKIGQERTHNAQRSLPTTNSWIAAFEPETGELLMICDGTLPTMYRTAAAAAVGIRHLARDDANTLAVIGAGQLGRQCVRAALATRSFDRVLLHDAITETAQLAATELSAQLGIAIAPVDAQTACQEADVIVTATNSRSPIVMSDWIRPGTHLSCMGADLPEKIECEPKLLPRCKIWSDQTEHCLQRGEVSQAVAGNLLSRDCYVGTLGQLINGDTDGRSSDLDITMFDGVGIGIQDTTILRAIYDQAVEDDLGVRFEFS